MAEFKEAKKIWMDGKFVDWKDAKIHVLSHVVHYGSAVFEGIRAYARTGGTAVFRMEDHYNRLLDSAKIYRMVPSVPKEEMMEATLELMKVNGLSSGYIRPLVMRGYRELGVYPLNCPVQVVIAAWEWGKYLGEEAMEKGIRCRISSWNRAAPNTFPSMAKIAGNYINSQLMKMEAIQGGFDEAIALDSYGFVSEGSGENIFMVKNGVIFTPPTSSSILAGITRHSVFKLAREMDVQIQQHVLPRESLYIADEVFLTGTAAEITPVVEIDNIPIKDGKRGPVTKRLQDKFFGILNGTEEDKYHWLSTVRF
jgi:branched-chain amino acid aminotransferase